MRIGLFTYADKLESFGTYIRLVAGRCSNRGQIPRGRTLRGGLKCGIKGYECTRYQARPGASHSDGPQQF